MCSGVKWGWDVEYMTASRVWSGVKWCEVGLGCRVHDCFQSVKWCGVVCSGVGMSST